MLRTLLTTSGQVETYSFIEIEEKRYTVKVEGTALSLALGACDVNTGKDKKGNDKNDGMAEMIASYFSKLNDGETEKANQIQAQFPEGWEEKEAERNKKDIAALHKVVNAIAESKNDDDKALNDALDEFREHLRPKAVIMTGMHFNPQLLIEAFKLYVEKYNAFGEYNSRMNNLFWREVIGGIQRFLPACDAQAFCQSLYDLVKDREKLNRSLKFRENTDVTFYPLDSDLRFRLGFNFAAAGGVVASQAGWLPPFSFDGFFLSFLKTYVEQKHQRCNDLRNVQTISRKTVAP